MSKKSVLDLRKDESSNAGSFTLTLNEALSVLKLYLWRLTSLWDDACAKAVIRVRLEGKDYEVQDGDIMPLDLTF